MMNIDKLFAAQKVLRDRIAYNEPDRFNKLILALLVELGECANEWRGFKFWSVNQIPHTSAIRVPAMMEEDKEYYNPLLEEYVDGLHFVLELGLVNSSSCVYSFDYQPYIVIENDVNTQFINLFFEVKTFAIQRTLDPVIELYLGLGEMLGFTPEQIEQAYFAKNAINHERQTNGY